jgi:hypothetical protein
MHSQLINIDLQEGKIDRVYNIYIYMPQTFTQGHVNVFHKYLHCLYVNINVNYLHLHKIYMLYI